MTPDGQGLLFMSDESLTGYDNAAQTGESGNPLYEVFLFQAQSGKLTCVSCNPSGEPPVRTELNTHYQDLAIGGFIPISKNFPSGEQPRVISDNGDRVFFNSGEPLLPTATNGWVNVYEWERAGTPGGSCPEDAPGGGCVYLISSGTDPETSYLLGTDASGENAFIVSRAQLVAEDHGSEDYEVYDARVDGGPPPAEASCSGTGCQGVPPPIFATPSSVTFNGIGNYPAAGGPAVKMKTAAELKAEKLAKALKACKKDKKKSRRAACEKQARKRYGAAKAKKSARRAGNDRRVGR